MAITNTLKTFESRAVKRKCVVAAY